MAQTPIRPFEVTNRTVVAIALPTTLAFLTTPLLGLVDTGVVGRLNDAALIGALAVGALLFDIIFTTFNFLRASTTGLVAQALGQGNSEQHKIVLMRSLVLSLAIGLIVLVLSPVLMWGGLWAINVPENIEEATRTYFQIRILSAPLTLINYSILGWLLGLARARLGLLLQTVLNGSNIILSIYLGLSLQWGLVGVAWATVIAEGIAVVLGLFLAWRYYRGTAVVAWEQLIDAAALKRLFGVNRDIMIRSFLLLAAFGTFTSLGAKFGETTFAANAVLMNFFLISGYFLDGFATAAEQLAGKSIGANYRPAFRKTVRLTLVWGVILAGAATLVFWFGGPWLIDIITTLESVRNEARSYLLWAALTALVGVVAFQMDGIYIGATWTEDMRNMMILSFAAFLLSCWIAVPLFGNHGLWFSLEVFLGLRGLSLFMRLKTRANEAFST